MRARRGSPARSSPGPRASSRAALDGRAAGVGPAVPVADAARSFRLACAALALAEERGVEAPLAVDAHRVELLWRAEPALVAALAAERLAPLAGETANSRARLEATLLAWLRHAGAVADAAASSACIRRRCATGSGGCGSCSGPRSTSRTRASSSSSCCGAR